MFFLLTGVYLCVFLSVSCSGKFCTELSKTIFQLFVS